MKKFLWIVTMVLAAGSVAWAASESPKEVAKTFWEAVAAKKRAEADALTVRGRFEVSLPVPVEIEKVEVKEANVTGALASVPTILTYAVKVDGLGRMECNATFPTELLKLENRWKVDEVVTAERFEKGIQTSALACGTRAVEDLIREGMAEFDRLRRSMEEGGAWNEAMKEFMERMKKEMAEEMKRMQRLMQRELNQTNPQYPVLPPPESGEKI
ncbi:hypothetical protein [Hydrogenimonas sp.]|uniref:hypothetical protein n=1 Tax=Hydrogenimonas sp. TaxID=2231112 RepID=UPI0026357934|nr:hypothetical protein [Hydrogenimonas sp.]